MNGKILKLDTRNINKIVNQAGSHNYVLLGESTHGTAEFFDLRLKITKALIVEADFNIVFFETEWSLGYKINRFIHGELNIHPQLLLEKLGAFYPGWMLNNKYILDLIIFMREWNAEVYKGGRGKKQKLFFYGIDCQDLELAKKNVCQEEHINCRIVADIIKNHKKMSGSKNYWDLRDTFWLHILESVKKDREKTGKSRNAKNKFILWAHNSHIGNIHANKPGSNSNTLNIASLLEELYPIYNVGFSTFNGTVKASSGYNRKSRIYKVRDAIKSSYEYVFS
jgi:erythromycin esterase-like protein